MKTNTPKQAYVTPTAEVVLLNREPLLSDFSIAVVAGAGGGEGEITGDEID